MKFELPSFLKVKDHYTPGTIIILAVVLSIIAGTASGIITNLVINKGSTLIPSAAVGNINSSSNSNLNQQQAQALNTAKNEDTAVVAAVSKVQPAVVSITISKQVSVNNNDPFQQLQIPGFPGFQFDFGSPTQDTNPSAGQQQLQQIGGGSGFIISSDGLILTNKHVVADAQAQYAVVLNDGKTTYPAKILATDPTQDLAVLKIDAKNLPVVTLGNSDNVKIGQTVIAIGNALSQFPNTVTKGIISGSNRQVTAGESFGQAETLSDVFQTDAAINPGNSGGPLIDLNGEVIGINTAVSQSAQLIGFAIPINDAQKDVTSVKATGTIVRPFLGVRYTPVTADLQTQNKLPVDYGALVIRGTNSGELAVTPGSPADKAGIVENDIILELNGTKIDQNNDLGHLIAQHAVGDVITLKILDKGQEKTVTATLTQYK